MEFSKLIIEKCLGKRQEVSRKNFLGTQLLHRMRQLPVTLHAASLARPRDSPGSGFMRAWPCLFLVLRRELIIALIRRYYQRGLLSVIPKTVQRSCVERRTFCV